MTEADVKRQIRRLIKKYDAKIVSYCPFPYGEPGTPDYIGCYRGRTILIEAKAPGKKLSSIQKIRKKEWESVGAVVLVVDNIEKFKEDLHEQGITEEKK